MSSSCCLELQTAVKINCLYVVPRYSPMLGYICVGLTFLVLLIYYSALKGLVHSSFSSLERRNPEDQISFFLWQRTISPDTLQTLYTAMKAQRSYAVCRFENFATKFRLTPKWKLDKLCMCSGCNDQRPLHQRWRILSVPGRGLITRNNRRPPVSYPISLLKWWWILQV